MELSVAAELICVSSRSVPAVPSQTFADRSLEFVGRGVQALSLWKFGMCSWRPLLRALSSKSLLFTVSAEGPLTRRTQFYCHLSPSGLLLAVSCQKLTFSTHCFPWKFFPPPIVCNTVSMFSCSSCSFGKFCGRVNDFLYK